MEENVKQNWNIFDINASYWRKTIFIIVIGFFCLVIYFSFIPHNLNIRHREFFHEKLQQSSIITIGGFYHFSTLASRWRGIITEQILLAYLSGLINATTNIYVTGLGKIDDNITIYNIFNNQKFIYEYNTKTDLYEFPTLKKLEKFCIDNNQSLVWYAHSKAASHEDTGMTPWRDAMNYYILDKWHHCYRLLSSTNYTTCGIALTFDSVRVRGWNTYYAGNMWWAKCSHINRLTRIEKLDQKDRYMAELYVTSEPDVGHFNCFYIDLRTPIQLNRQNASCTINYPLWVVR